MIFPSAETSEAADDATLVAKSSSASAASGAHAAADAAEDAASKARYEHVVELLSGNETMLMWVRGLATELMDQSFVSSIGELTGSFLTLSVPPQHTSDTRFPTVFCFASTYGPLSVSKFNYFHPRLVRGTVGNCCTIIRCMLMTYSSFLGL